MNPDNYGFKALQAIRDRREARAKKLLEEGDEVNARRVAALAHDTNEALRLRGEERK